MKVCRKYWGWTLFLWLLVVMTAVGCSGQESDQAAVEPPAGEAVDPTAAPGQELASAATSEPDTPVPQASPTAEATATAEATQRMLGVLGVDAVRTGNALTVNGVPIAVAEACNGLRMAFALILVSYAFAYSVPIREPVRILIVAMSPVTASREDS